jgi:N-acetyl-anhydromuramyl-L-alanine amidase AmpD
MNDIVKMQSPNFTTNSIIKPFNPKIIVIHWMAGSYDSSVSWLCNKDAQASAHFCINRDGSKISQLVDLKDRAWHCNPSYHPNYGEHLNRFAVGIECEGPPSIINTNTWKLSFMNSLVDLCEYITEQCPTIEGITDHSTIAPQIDKIDVLGGVGKDWFPWAMLVDAVGLPDLATNEMRAKVRKFYKMES